MTNLTQNNKQLDLNDKVYFGSLFRILGSLFYYQPETYSDYGINQVFKLESTSIPELDLVLTEFKDYDSAKLVQAHNELIAGIAEITAPPWGSVYLDKESVLFGESTLMYRQFLTQVNLQFTAPNNDPEDHIGLMLMMLGLLIENEDAKSEDINELLAVHLLPWAPTYLSNFIKVASKTPYAALATFTEQLLLEIKELLSISVHIKQIYFNANI